MLVAHLSDLHLRSDDDLQAFERQLDRIRERGVAHLAITGDLLDRWNVPLLERALDALELRGFLDAQRLTILHGNHDLASSGGHPRRSADLWRLAVRFWDPPPLVARRRQQFYATIGRRGVGIAALAPFVKELRGWRIAVLDTVPLPWRPLSIGPRGVTVQHAIGCVRRPELEWLRALPAGGPLAVLIHHFPLDAPEYRWRPEGALRYLTRKVRVPMTIPDADLELFWSAIAAARARLVLCGHVHRAGLAWKDGVAVGLNGQSGADWAGRTIAYYDLSARRLEQVQE